MMICLKSNVSVCVIKGILISFSSSKAPLFQKVGEHSFPTPSRSSGEFEYCGILISLSDDVLILSRHSACEKISRRFRVGPNSGLTQTT